MRVMYRAARRAIGTAINKLIYKSTSFDVLDQGNWHRSISRPNLAYAHFTAAFENLPDTLVNHRIYFEQEQRGFGDRAFHVMWYALVTALRPRDHLEIGVYRGQTLSLVALLQSLMNIEQGVVGVSPLTDAGDSVSNYPDIDYRADVLENFRHFDLQEPRLIEAFSTDESAKRAIAERRWDSIYIDGSHDYEVVKNDWDLCAEAVRKGGIIVLDDAALYTKFLSLRHGYKGVEGPSSVARRAMKNDERFEAILQVGHNLVFQKIA